MMMIMTVNQASQTTLTLDDFYQMNLLVIEKNRKNHDITNKTNHENTLLSVKTIYKKTIIGMDSPPNQNINVYQKNRLSENKKQQPTVIIL